MSAQSITITIPLATALENRANGPVGETRGARFARAREKRDLRALVFTVVTSAPEWRRAIARWEIRGGKRPRAVPVMRDESWLAGPVTVTLTRIAPGTGDAGKLDGHDGLPHAFKSVTDAIADALGLRADRDRRVSWRYAQRDGSPAIEMRVEVRATCACGENLEPRWRGCPMCLRAKGAA